jgi:hypothetical protein
MPEIEEIMKRAIRVLPIIAALTVAAGANAALNLNLNQYVWDVTPGSTATISGSITLQDGWSLSGGILESPGNGTDFLTVNFAPGFLNFFFNHSPGDDYVGELFLVETNANTTLGLYWLNDSANGFSPLSEFILSATNGGPNLAIDSEMYAINVVPEPATMAALGLGLALVARRRRRK